MIKIDIDTAITAARILTDEGYTATWQRARQPRKSILVTNAPRHVAQSAIELAGGR